MAGMARRAEYFTCIIFRVLGNHDVDRPGTHISQYQAAGIGTVIRVFGDMLSSTNHLYYFVFSQLPLEHTT